MARIRPFRALRFTPAAGTLDELLAPPSQITREERARLAAHSNNIVHALLPEGQPDDRSKYVRYARASAQLSSWRRGGILAVDERPSFYGWSGVLLALVQIEHGSTAPVRPEDPLRLLEATRTYIEPIPLPCGALGDDVPMEDALTPFTFYNRLMVSGEVEVAEAEMDARLAASRAFLGERAAEDGRPESWALAAFVPPGAPEPPSGLVLWSLGDFA